jgi:iron complex outermembrane receptor protein
MHDFKMIRGTLLCSTALLITGRALAGDPPAGADTGNTLEEVVVTGTLLRNADATNARPITLVNEDAINHMGATTIDQVLSQVVAMGTQGQTGAAPLGQQDGNTYIDLRNLGPARTLVLVNGRRFVPTVGQLFVGTDLNNIPVGIIDHIEVLRDGASTTYGADAVGGVINIITHKKFDGVQLDADGGVAGAGDRQTGHFSLTAGKSTTHDSVLINFDYLARSPAEARNGREYATAGISSASYDAAGAAVFTRGIPFTSGGVVTNSATGIPEFTLTGPGQYRAYSPSDNTNPPANPSLAAGDHHAVVNLLANHDFSQSLTTYAELTYSHRTNAVPGFIPTTGEVLNVPAANPGNFFNQPVTLLRNLQEVPPPVFTSWGETYRGVLGLKGSAGARFTWDLSVNYGKSSSTSEYINQVDVGRLATALDPTLCARAAGCAVLNPFGPGSISPAAVNYVRLNDTQDVTYRQTDILGSIAGELWQLPAGTVGGAFGVEHRRESGSNLPDPAQVAGTSSVGLNAPTGGKFGATEFYAEFNVPLLKDLPGVKSLGVNLSARQSHFDQAGSATTWKTGLNWALTDSFRLRSSYSTAFRIPNLYEAFGGRLTSSYVLVDPCAGAADPATVARCRAAGLGSGFVSVSGNTNVITGGNAALHPESSRNLDVGMVLTPVFVPQLAVAIDYFSIHVDRAIQSLDPQYVLNQCYSSDASYCADVSRFPNGQLREVDAIYGNIGQIKTDGLESTASYEKPLADLGVAASGRITANATATYLMRFDRQNTPGGNFTSYVGTLAANAITGSFPRLKANLSLGYRERDWQVGWTGRYISGMHVRDVTPGSAPLSEVNSVVYQDLFGEVRYGSTTFTLGVQNLTNRQPPQFFPGGFDPATYDVIGRYFFGKVSIRF